MSPLSVLFRLISSLVHLPLDIESVRAAKSVEDEEVPIRNEFPTKE